MRLIFAVKYAVKYAVKVCSKMTDLGGVHAREGTVVLIAAFSI